jgi:hypothetical protein
MNAVWKTTRCSQISRRKGNSIHSTLRFISKLHFSNERTKQNTITAVPIQYYIKFLTFKVKFNDKTNPTRVTNCSAVF